MFPREAASGKTTALVISTEPPRGWSATLPQFRSVRMGPYTSRLVDSMWTYVDRAWRKNEAKVCASRSALLR